MSNKELIKQLNRTEDAVGRQIAAMLESVEIMALEYTAHGDIAVMQLEIIDGASEVLEHQSAALAVASDLEAIVKQLRHSALEDRPMESINQRIERLRRERIELAQNASEAIDELTEGVNA